MRQHAGNTLIVTYFGVGNGKGEAEGGAGLTPRSNMATRMLVAAGGLGWRKCLPNLFLHTRAE